MVGLLGPNGGGKSTLLLSLSGVLPHPRRPHPYRRAGLVRTFTQGPGPPLAAVPQRLDSAFDLPAFSVVLMGRPYPHNQLLGRLRPERPENLPGRPWRNIHLAL
jgi:ABC-type cobalamin/Fe3+-siderophores transport system ATPase subunit